MVDTLIVVGNGLGRAISNEFFSLERALQNAWLAPDVLTEHQKALILSCLPPAVVEADDPAPTSEDELEDLQRVLNACETISVFEKRVERDGEAWLTRHGLEFPVAIRRYIHKAACHFHDRAFLDFFEDIDVDAINEFEDALRAYIMEHGAHVATLNYDDLLYECFTGTPVFNDHRLRDGFFGGRFDFERHEEYLSPQLEGWFLHLHGSPLFVTIEGEPRKITRAQLANYQGHDSTHLVLTNIKFKRAAILASEILSAYWKKLQDVIPHMRNIVVFGYGGGDTHLNLALGRASNIAQIRVVERGDPNVAAVRTSHWRDLINHPNITVLSMENVLYFREWERDDAALLF